MTLETATPTFGIAISELQPWHLSTNRPGVLQTMMLSAAPTDVSTRHRRNHGLRATQMTDGEKPLGISNTNPAENPIVDSEDDLQMAHRYLPVSSNGTLNATFSVPDLITIPSDEQAHSVTIVQLELEATLSWIAVPSVDTKTHLSVSELLDIANSASSRTLILCFSGKDQERVGVHFPSRYS